MVQNLLIQQKKRYFFTGRATISFSIITFLHVIIKYTHFSIFAVVMMRNVQCKSNFAHSVLSMHMVNYVCIHNGVHLKSKLLTH
jgi:hypothetical protein